MKIIVLQISRKCFRILPTAPVKICPALKWPTFFVSILKSPRTVVTHQSGENATVMASLFAQHDVIDAAVQAVICDAASYKPRS